MRKLKLQVQMSVDGYIARPNGELDWMVWDWDDMLKKYVGDLTESIDTILLGRKLAEGFIDYWDAADPETVEGAKIFKNTPKVVFTKTLTENKWKRTSLAQGNLTEEVNKLKNGQGGDLITYGGGEFVSSLIKEGLIDDFYLFVNPVALGKGMPIFEKLEEDRKLNLVEAKGFDCGITVLHYTK